MSIENTEGEIKMGHEFEESLGTLRSSFSHAD